MDLFQLEIFLTVAREGSFSRAAEKLYRTQPAISQAIRKLEREVGEPLFDRSSRDGILTDAGQLLQDYCAETHQFAQRSASRFERTARDAQGEARDSSQRVHLSLPAACACRISHALPYDQSGRASFACEPYTADVIKHSAELGGLSFNPEEPLLRSIVVYRDELALVVNPKHPLASAQKVSIRQLGAETFVAHNVQSPYRAKVIEAFKRHKTPLNMDVELPTIDAINRSCQAARAWRCARHLHRDQRSRAASLFA